MAQKSLAVLVILLFLGAGFFIGSLAGGFIGHLTVPASHKAIIDSMQVIDTIANFKLTPKLVDSSNVECAKGLSVMFIKGKTYPQTVWLWQRYGDTDIIMNIWGPDETGKTYSIEIARVAWNSFKIKINGETKLTIDQVTSTAPAIGYYQLEVQVG